MDDFIKISRYASPTESNLIAGNLDAIPTQGQFEWGVNFHNRIQWLKGKSQVSIEKVRSWVGYTGLPVRKVPYRKTRGKVPRIIHQIWIGPSAIPDRCGAWMDEIAYMNPDMEYHFWSNNLFKKYENDPLIKRMVEMDAKYPYISDRFRMLLLRDYGGIYIDVDVEPIKPLEPLILENENNDFTTAKRKKGNHPDLDILIAKKNSGVVEQLLTSEQTIHLGKPLIEAILLQENVSYTDSDYWYAETPNEKSYLQSEGNHLLSWLKVKECELNVCKAA